MKRLQHDQSDRVRLGRVIRRLRKSKEMTQEGLAGVAGVTKNYLADIERGARNPSYVVLSRIVRALRVPWAEFGAGLDAESG